MESLEQRILIVDDEPHMQRTLQIMLNEELSLDVDCAGNYYEALEKISPDTMLAIIDLTMPGKDGLELLKEIQKINPSISVIMMTAYSTVESAIEAIRGGAVDYLIKPFSSEKLLTCVEKLIQKSPSNGIDTKKLKNRCGDLIGGTKVMQEVYNLIERASKLDNPVLIYGEPGTGKELAARAIHYRGTRHRFPFFVLPCQGIKEQTLNKALFGFERRTRGNKVRQPGVMEQVDEGTLFLDNVSLLTPSQQLKLYQAIQDKVVTPIGSKAPYEFKGRIIAATKGRLFDQMRDGDFREDLFYRLNGFVIEMPPLRAHKEDIPLLVEDIVGNKAKQLNLRPKGLSKGAEELLHNHTFPGNVRELENILERAIIVSRHRTIHKEDLLINRSKEGTGSDELSSQPLPIEDGWKRIQEVARDLEKELIQRAVATYKGFSNSEIAELLGTSRRILELRLKEYEIEKS